MKQILVSIIFAVRKQCSPTVINHICMYYSSTKKLISFSYIKYIYIQYIYNIYIKEECGEDIQDCVHSPLQFPGKLNRGRTRG